MLTEQAKEQRKKRITSTRAPAICGMDSQKGLHGVARDILGIDGEEWAPGEEPIYLLRGSHFEDSIVTLFEQVAPRTYPELAGCKTKRSKFRVHPSLKYVGTSIDRTVHKSDDLVGGLEAKSYLGAKRHEFGEPGTDQVDRRTFIQCVIHMAVLDLPRCWVPLDTGFDFQIFCVDRDRELEDAVLAKCEAFWHRWIVPNMDKPLDAIELPEVDGHTKTTDWIKKRYTEHTGEMIGGGHEHRAMAIKREDLRLARKELEAEQAEIDNKLRDLIGATGGAGIEGDDFKVTWKQTKGRTVTDWQEIGRQLGVTAEMVQQHTAVAPGHRTLRVNVKGVK